MKKILQIICCALGSGMIGFFANQLNIVHGCVLFTLGVAMLVASIVIIKKIKMVRALYGTENNRNGNIREKAMVAEGQHKARQNACAGWSDLPAYH